MPGSFSRASVTASGAGNKKFVIVDAGMNDLIRPALYQSYHEIVPVREAGLGRTGIGGCGRSRLRKRRFFRPGPAIFPKWKRAISLALMSAGAYGFAMASNYNSRPLPRKSLVQGDSFSLIRRRQTMEDLMREECADKPSSS